MDDVQFIFVSKAPVAVPQAITESDWDDLTGRVDDLEEGIDLGDVNDVDLVGLVDGNTIIWDDSTDTWVPGELASGQEIYNNTTPVMTGSIGTNYHPSLTAAVSGMPGAPKAHVQVTFGGTGSATSAAKSDHSHTQTLVSLTTGSATGNLSSGTRNLRNTTGPTLADTIVYDVEGVAIVRARNNVNNGIVNLLFRVGSSGSYLQRSRSVGTVGGVPVDQIIHFHAVLTGAGTGVTEYFGVQYSSGDATDLRDHEVFIKYHPRR